MKNTFTILYLLSSILVASATQVMFPLNQMFGGVVYQKTFQLQAKYPLVTDGTNTWVGKTYFISPSGGTNPIAIVTPNTYSVVFTDANTPWTITVPDSTQTLNAVSLTSSATLPSYTPDIFNGSNIYAGTISSNKLDAATLAMFGGASNPNALTNKSTGNILSNLTVVGGTFSGDGSGLVNVTAAAPTAAQIATVGGLTNASVVFAFTNGAYYANGQWFATTPVNVIQAAINALPFSPVKNAISGGTVHLGTGIFDTVATITYSNSYTSTLKLVGAGMLATVIKANGPYTALYVTSNDTNDAPVIFKMEDLSLVNSVVCTNYLLDLRHWGSANVGQCLFADWYNVTNNVINGNPFFQVGLLNAVRPTGLLGVYLPACQGDTAIFDHCNFDGLGMGVATYADHDLFRDCQFQGIGMFHPAATDVFTNTWDKSSIFNVGAAIYVGSGGLQDHNANGCSFYKCQSPTLVDVGFITVRDARLESCAYDGLVASEGYGVLTCLGDGSTYGQAVYNVTNSATAYAIQKNTPNQIAESFHSLLFDSTAALRSFTTSGGEVTTTYLDWDGNLQATSFSGAGGNLTGLTGANLTGTIPASVLPALSGAITTAGNSGVTSLGSFSSASLRGAITDETGSGSSVFSNSPTIFGLKLTGNTTNVTVAPSGATTNFMAVTNGGVEISLTPAQIKQYLGYLDSSSSLNGANLTAGTVAGTALNIPFTNSLVSQGGVETNMTYYVGAGTSMPFYGTNINGFELLITNANRASWAAWTVQSSGGTFGTNYFSGGINNDAYVPGATVRGSTNNMFLEFCGANLLVNMIGPTNREIDFTRWDTTNSTGVTNISFSGAAANFNIPLQRGGNDVLTTVSNLDATKLTGLVPASSLPTIIQLGFAGGPNNYTIPNGYATACAWAPNGHSAPQAFTPVTQLGGFLQAAEPLPPGTYTNLAFNLGYPGFNAGTNVVCMVFTNGVFAMQVILVGPTSNSSRNFVINSTNSFTLVGQTNLVGVVLTNNSPAALANGQGGWSIQRYQ